MVYCGKPSAGCGACRARKVKCDQTRPACNRCIKANRDCPGYRDHLSLLFRDQSRAVARKAKSATPDSSSASSPVRQPSAANPSLPLKGTVGVHSPASTPDELDFSSDVVVNSIPSHPFTVNRKFEAACFFFDSFAWLYSGVMKWCDPYGDTSSTTPLGKKAMMNAIASVGMANLSSIQGSHSLRVSAWREYAEALKWTNAAISDRTQVTEDTTLAAILCLSLFEILTCKHPATINDFIQHTNGAIALLELRGESQLQLPDSLHLFFALRNEVVIGCILQRLPVPRRLIALSEKATKLPTATPITKAGHNLNVIMASVCDLRISHENHRSSINADLLSYAFALDSRIEDLKNNFSEDFMYETVTAAPETSFKLTESRRIFPLNGIYHIYSSWGVTNVWNVYRYARILINEVILNQLRLMTTHPDADPPTQDLKDLCYRSCCLVRSLADDICASVPCLLQLVGSSDQLVKSSAGGLTILFPLFIAGGVDGPEHPKCRWAQECFRIVGRALGIDQALTLADMLPDEKPMTAFVDALNESLHEQENGIFHDMQCNTPGISNTPNIITDEDDQYYALGA
ncbi:putative C6 finger domain protein [Talaromyces proteolyticus]|uniref:C6 finger domain protein n=1 Tax=Talaromyces proteolyticus TaxID=1131652 RepID=A0AAD4Q1Y4_9EURO|nr:putative C6 finger domain protein [Talaromyces proteolyticus]KAH8699043.1 putative C6 finger domain protein [Talaromyces proteolyticus]